MARADVSFRDKEARVAYDPAQVTVEHMIAAVNGAGFRASVKRPGEEQAALVERDARELANREQPARRRVSWRRS